MQKRLLFMVVMFLTGTFLTNLYAQTHTVSGVVTDKDNNEPLMGVSVLVKGTNLGAITDANGAYSLKAADKDALVFSYVSMKTVTENVNGRQIINVKMTTDSESLGEVVVTAMGIKRQSETLTYSAQTVGGKDVNDIKSVNMINSLQGKSAGLMITPNSTGAGGASKILFRGNKSINGNNQPLIVLDGMPLLNVTSSQVSGGYGQGRDGGDVMSTINPDDIASITLLKGASAAALYGAVAANGAIMITTKSAQSGKVSVNVSSNTTVETPLVLPKFQNTYGMDDSGSGKTSWGGVKLSSEAPNYLKEFFRTGFTTNNSIALSGGNENVQSYFSYANVYSNGITPTNNYKSHVLNAKVGFNVLKNIHIDFNAKYTNQHNVNQAASGYLGNPLTGAYLFPRGEDWNYYKNNYSIYDADRGTYVQNWLNTSDKSFDNPYWLLNNAKSTVDRHRYEFGGSAKWTVTDWFNIQGRMRYERQEEKFQNDYHASSIGNYYPMGRYFRTNYYDSQLYADVLATVDKTFGHWALTVSAGASMTKQWSNSLNLRGEGDQATVDNNTGKVNGNVWYPNIFIPSNYYRMDVSPSEQEKRLNAVFATAQIGWKEALFLDVTARNDWSSTLAFTDGCSFFYPSVGATALLNKLADFGKNVDLLKLRASYSIVGNDVPIGITNLRYTLGDNGALKAPEKAPFKKLKPEKTHSLEIGFDGTFLQNRLNTSITYYKMNTKNQFFIINAPYVAGINKRYINAGNVENQGVEANVSWVTEFNKDFSWKTGLNFAYNTNKVKELVDELKDGVELSQYGSNGAVVRIEEGGSFGDLYVRDFERDEKGQIKWDDATGRPLVTSEATTKVGNMNAKVNMGWTNAFYYKDFTLSFLIDAKFGGKVLSMTEASLDYSGVSERTGKARDDKNFSVEGHKADPQTYYQTIGANDHNSKFVGSQYVYNATNVRLRELSLGYTFRNLMGIGKNLTAAFIARNLFFFYKDAPMDPDVSASINNGYQGIDCFALPSTRSFGLNLKLNF